jgi:hypothetical protein
VNQEVLLYLKLALFKDKYFVFPGLGEFSIERKPAFFSDNQTTLNPPKYSINFSDKIKSNSNFINHKQYEEQFISISSKIQNDLFTFNSSSIEGLGNFFKNENGQIHFISDIQFEQYFNPGYEQIQNINPIDKLFNPANQDFHAVNTNTLVYEKPKTEILVRPKIESKIINWKWIFIGFLALALIIGFFFIPRPAFDFDYINQHNNKVITSTKKEEANLNNSPTEPTKSMIDFPSETDSISALRKNKNLNCAIITGSFKNANNIIRMRKRLQSLGYEIYTEKTDSTTRIGVKYDCTDTNAEELLNKIRAEIDSTSWVLR